MLIKRDILKRLKKDLKRKEIIALVGSRQVGKTTIMKELQKEVIEQSIFLTFEKLEDLKIFEQDIDFFISKYVKNNQFLFIDEFHYAQSGGQQLKYIYDTCQIKIIISGSSEPELAIHSLQYLVGRVFIYKIYPLTFKEFINFKSNENNFLLQEHSSQKRLAYLEKQFEEYLLYGSYPEVVKEEEKDIKITILENLVNSYLLKEIKDILSYKNIFEYETLLQRFALQDGALLNKNTFSHELGIYNNKINEMTSILEKTYILSLVRPFLRNKIKEQIKSPKSYIQDLGFKNTLIKNFNPLSLKQDKGMVYENFICNTLLRNGIKVGFWNIQNRHEVDFVYEKDGNIIGIEVKSKLKNDSITASMKKFIELLKPSHLYVFNENIDASKKIDNTEIIFTHFINAVHLQ